MAGFLLITTLLLHYFSTGYSWKNLDFLDLGSNLLQGTLSPSLCNMTSLKYLLLSDNQFSGTIPECLGNMSMQLTVLDLKRNKFTGTIPTHFPKGNTLRNLGLNGNQLGGTLPQSILSCTSLEVLDIGHNAIEGPFPDWLGSLPALSVLILTRNKFHGTISTGSVKEPFQMLRILDVSYNRFNGSVPEAMIRSFEGMKKKSGNDSTAKYGGDSSYYEDSVTLLIKGLEMELERVLTTFTTIDLAGNSFEGKIPESIGELKELRILNMLHNFFSGHIPPVLGDVSALESLDLSGNKLSGVIPPELVKLNFLEFFNVSQNKLVGRIPSGRQFNTFDVSSYDENSGLCGRPLNDCNKTRNGSESYPSSIRGRGDAMDGLTWESVAFGFGVGMILGILAGGLMLYTKKPKWFHDIVVDVFELQSKLYTTRRGLNWD